MAAPRLGAEAGAQWRLPAGEAAEGGEEEEEEEDEREEKEEEDVKMWRLEVKRHNI